MDYMINGMLIEMEDEQKQQEDAKILKEYYERLRKESTEGKEKNN